MANWDNLKSAVSAVIKENGNGEITGAVLQQTLNNIITTVGENATFAGIALPTTNPGTPDGSVFYLATEVGTYSNFEKSDGSKPVIDNYGTIHLITNQHSGDKTKWAEYILHSNANGGYGAAERLFVKPYKTGDYKTLIEAFYDIKLNVEKIFNAHYGLVYAAFKYNSNGECTGLYFENYYWIIDSMGKVKFTDLSDSFTIPISVIDEGDKLSYYKSPAGKFEFLVNWYRVFALRDTLPKLLFSTTTAFEFTDAVTDKNAASPIIAYKAAIRNTDTGRILNAYIDNLVIQESSKRAYDFIDSMNYNNEFFAVGIWSKIEEQDNSTCLIDRVEAYVSKNQNTEIAYKLKLFNTSIPRNVDLWDDSYGELICEKIIDIDQDIINDILIINLQNIEIPTGAAIILLLQPTDNTANNKVNFGYIKNTPNSLNIPYGTSFYFKVYNTSSTYKYGVISAEFAYYQMPLKIYSKFPVEKRVATLEQKVVSLESLVQSTAINPRVVIPKYLYAIVGREFNLYYDAFMLLPEIGTGQNNILFDISCDIGTCVEKSFRVSPMTSQIGNHAMTIQIINSNGSVIYSYNTTLIVVPNIGPSIEKRILLIGDSTTDDTAQVAIGLNNNFNELDGGVKPVLVGHKIYYNNPEIKHCGATGKTLSFYANGTTAYKFNIASGVPTSAGVYPNLSLTLPDGTGKYVNVWTTNNGDGSGSIIATIWREGSTIITEAFTGALKTDSRAGWPSVVNVTSTEKLTGWSPIRFNGNIDFNEYASAIGLNSYNKIDLLSIDLGINDSRGPLQSENTQLSKIENAKKIIEAFHTYNPNGKVMICLTKSCAAPRSRSNSSHDMYRLNIQRLRELLLKYFDNNPEFPYCFICSSGLSIDRFWGYNIATVPAGSRYPDNTIIVNTEDIHPRTEGYYQVADAMSGCIIHLLTT